MKVGVTGWVSMFDPAWVHARYLAEAERLGKQPLAEGVVDELVDLVSWAVACDGVVSAFGGAVVDL